MKSNIRSTILEKRRRLAESQVRQWSSAIKENLYSLAQFHHAKAIMIYVSKAKEAYTHDIIEENLRKKRVCVPAVRKDRILPALINYFDELKPGAFNVLEPRYIVDFPLDQIELVIVPGVAFDEKGNRIGYGKGYFDRFLKRLSCPKAGLCYEMQLVESVPRKSTDVPLDIIITEKRIISVQR